jgi:regulator of protease activity HflC (stomatin/prohibitin superfamily)
MRKGQTNEIKTFAKLITLFIVIGVVASFILGSLAIVPAGNRGVLLTWGKVENRILPEGISMITPFVNQVQLVSVQTMKFSATASSASADLQIVTTEVTLNYHIDPAQVNSIYQQLTMAYEDRVIAPAIQEAIKASTARYTAEELITKRPLVKDAIETSLKEKLSNHGILVDSVFLTDFKFSEGFEKAIEDKVTAQQLALKAENDLKRITVEAQQVVVAAQGQADAKLAVATAEAKSIQIQGAALRQNPEVISLKYIQAWNGLLPQYLLVTGDAKSGLAGMILNLPTASNGNTNVPADIGGGG